MKYFFSILLLFFIISAHATVPLRVGVPDGYIPISYINDGEPQGLSVDVWEEIAKMNHLSYVYVPLSQNMDQHWQALQEGKLDVLLGPVSIQPEDMNTIQYSLPYFLQDISLLAPIKSKHIQDLLQGALKEYLWAIIIGYFLFFLIYIHIVWLIEHVFYKRRQDKPHGKSVIPQSYPKAFWNLFCYHITFDNHFFEVPKKTLSQIMYFSYVYITLAFLTIIGASITSVLTTTSIDNNNPETFNTTNIQQKTLAYMMHRPFYKDFVESRHLHVVPAENMDEAMTLLKAHKVDAIINSQTLLQDYLQTHHITQYVISPFSMGYIFYYFALPAKSKIDVNIINKSIIKIHRNSLEEGMCRKYNIEDPKYCAFY